LKDTNRHRYIAQPSRPQIEQVYSAEQYGGGIGHQNLTTVPGSHYPCSTVEHRSEVVVVPQLGLPGRNAHSHRQLEFPLGCDSGDDRRFGRRESGYHPVSGVTK
jgi:hypothetical protein